MEEQEPDPSSRTSLYERGWRQGVVFSPPLEWQMTCLVNVKSDEGVRRREKVLAQSEKLLLISHDCDIANSSFPYVEALVCKTFNVETESGLRNIRRIGPNDPRSFVINREAGIVAETKYRVIFEKGLLNNLSEPEFVISEELEIARFREWLAMRYARAVFPDRLHELIFYPLVQIIRKDQDANSSAFRLVDELLHGIRVRVLNEEAEILEVGLLIVLKDIGDDLTAAHLDAVKSLVTLLTNHLYSHDQIRFAGTQQVLYEEVRYVDIQRTMALSTDWASYNDDWQITGAEPLHLVEEIR